MIEKENTFRKPSQIALIVGTAVYGLSLSLWLLGLGWLAISLSYKDVPFAYAAYVPYPLIVIGGLLISFLLYIRKHYRASMLALFIPIIGAIIAVVGLISTFP